MSKGIEYINKLGEAYNKCGLQKEWSHLLDIEIGITPEQEEKLLEIFPDIPQSLIDILKKVDGTYYREYDGEEVLYYFFGSDVDDGEYPYYLFSFENIVENKDSAKYFADYFYDAKEEIYGLFLDDKILPEAEKLKWLCFSDCMNNGGTSRLYIDFTPSSKGVKGQIVRYLHDPDELRVIANSFDEFLDMLVDNGLKFIHEDDF